MTESDLKPARLAHIKGMGLIDIELEPTRDRNDQFVYSLRGQGGMFHCEPVLSRQELELLCGRELTFVGYGRSALGAYTLSADVRLGDLGAFPRVQLRIMRIHEVMAVELQELALAS